MAAALRTGGMAGVLAAGALALAGCAPPTPVTLGVPTAEAPAAPRPIPKKAIGPACTLTVAELRDARRAPEDLGAVGGRAVKAPADRDAWLKSVVGGLGGYGYTVGFAPDAAPSETAVTARITLLTAWVTNVRANKVANVVLHVVAERPGQPTLVKDYRGNRTVVNWAGTEDELKDVVDDAFADALADIARDIRPLCPAS